MLQKIAPSKKTLSKLWLWLRILISLLLLFLVFNKLDIQSLKTTWEKSNWLELFLGFLSLGFGLLVAAFRWHLQLQILKDKGSLWTHIKEYMESHTISQVLPGNITGDLYRVYALSKRLGNKPLLSAHTLLADRVGGFLGLIISGGLGAFFATHYPLSIKIIVSLMTFLGILGWLALSLEREFLLFWLKKITFKLFKTPLAFFRVFSLFAKGKRGFLVFLLSILGHLASSLGLFLLFLSLGEHQVSFWAVSLMFSSILIALVLPISLGGWGFRELLMANFAPWLMASESSAILVSLLLGSAYLIWAIVGALTLAFKKLKH